MSFVWIDLGSQKDTMPQEQPKASQSWKKNGPIAAQLFRDIFFGKYQKGANGKFNTKAIYDDPSRDYHTLPRTSFYRHIKSTAQRVDQYRLNGTGLDTEEFCQLVNLSTPPPPEDRAAEPATGLEDQDEEEDPNYEDEEEEDIKEDIEGFEAEELDIAKQAAEEVAESIQRARRTTRTTPRKTDDMPDNITKYLAMEPDGRLIGVIHLPSGFDGTIEFNEGDEKTAVFQKEVKQQWMYNASRVFQKKGLGRNNVHVISLQAQMDKQKKKDIKAMGEDPDMYTGPITISSKIFDLPYPVTPFFYDEDNNPTGDIQVDGDEAEWAYFWMLDAKKNKPKAQKTRLVRNRNRRRNGTNENNNNHANPSPSNQSRRTPQDAGSRRSSPRRRTAVPMDEDSTYFYFDADEDGESVDVSLWIKPWVAVAPF